MNHNRDAKLLRLALIFFAFAAILCAAAVLTADAADAERTCYVYPVTLHNVHCTLGWCSAYEDVHINGRSAVTVYVSGWRLRNGMIRPVTVCR